MSARAAGDAGLIEALRARRDKGKESVSRDMAQDRRASMKARGILTYLLSKPDKWRTNAQAIADDCDRDGRDAIASGLKELEELGYLARKKRRAAHGRFVWFWIYSDDPDEVAELLAMMFPEGEPSVARRGRARKATVGGEPAGPAMTGNPGHGAAVESEPAGHTMNGFPVDGSAVDGSAVDGEPVDIEKEERENYPPNPPRGGGDPDPSGEEALTAAADRCEAHGRSRCRPCGLSPRVQARAERDREAAELAERERVGQACPMCKADGTARDGGTRWIRVLPGTQEPITPFRLCDHEMSYQQVLREIADEEAAAEQARRERPSRPTPRCTPGSVAAREALNEARAKRRAAGAASTDTSGLEKAAAPVVDQKVLV